MMIGNRTNLLPESWSLPQRTNLGSLCHGLSMSVPQQKNRPRLVGEGGRDFLPQSGLTSRWTTCFLGCD